MLQHVVDHRPQADRRGVRAREDVGHDVREDLRVVDDGRVGAARLEEARHEVAARLLDALFALEQALVEARAGEARDGAGGGGAEEGVAERVFDEEVVEPGELADGGVVVPVCGMSTGWDKGWGEGNVHRGV